MTWATAISLLGLVGGLTGAYVSLRRLRGQRGLDAAQRDSLISEAAGQVVQMSREELLGCREDCARLRLRVDLLEAHVIRLESALRDAGLPVPPREGDQP